MYEQMGDEYRNSRMRMQEIAASLSDEEANTIVAACPEWTVKDLFSHVTGLAADLGSGKGPTGDTQVWVDELVTSRKGRSNQPSSAGLRQRHDRKRTTAGELSGVESNGGLHGTPIALFVRGHQRHRVTGLTPSQYIGQHSQIETFPQGSSLFSLRTVAQ